MRILGVDLISEGRGPRYAAVLLQDGTKILEKRVSRWTLLRLIEKEKPDFLAVDHIRELNPRKRDSWFLRRIFELTRVVQVTGMEDGRSLQRLCKDYGIDLDPRNPFSEAEAVARLVELGIGYEARLLEDRTRIVVSRGRSIGRGGWSQNRYARNIHASVLATFNRILEKIKERNLRFEYRVRRAEGGIARGEIIVEENIRNLGSIAESKRFGNVRIKVEPFLKGRIEFVPLRMDRRFRRVVVGIDPGTTTALAIVDLEGNLLYLDSVKGLSKEDIVEKISEFGKPIVIATDVAKVPSLVEEIARKLGARILARDLSVREKIDLTKEYSVRDSHQRDALAAAILAHKSLKTKINRIVSLVGGEWDLEKEEILDKVLKGYSVRRAIEEVRRSSKPISRRRAIEERKPKAEEISELLRKLENRERKIEELERENELLRRKIHEYESKIEELQARIERLESEHYEKLRRDREIALKDRVIEELRDLLEREREERRKLELELERLRKEIEVMKRRSIVAKVLPKFTKSEIERLDREIGLGEGDVVLILDPSGGSSTTARMLIERGLLCAIADIRRMSHQAIEEFRKKGFPLIEIEKIDYEVIGDLALIDRSGFEEEIRRARSSEKWEEMDLERLLREYREERLRELKSRNLRSSLQ